MSNRIKLNRKPKHLSAQQEQQVEKCISFNFKYLSNKSYTNSRDVNFFIHYFQRLVKLSELTWKQINQADRHGFGYETLGVENIKVSMPNIITDDVRKLLVFRATGDNHAFLGLREGDVFNVIFIEANFGDIYKH